MSFDGDCIFQMSAKQRKAHAITVAEKLRCEGAELQPVTAKSRGKIANSFWGHQWCLSLESFEDMDYRLISGRSFLRSGSVIDLKIEQKTVTAVVVDDETFEVKIDFKTLDDELWQEIISDCAGKIDSLVDLLSGNFTNGVIERFIDSENGLFPASNEIKFSCNCLDYADMCKHIAAVLYGIGVRFDSAPDLFFELRGVCYQELVERVGSELVASVPTIESSTSKSQEHLNSLFDIDLID